MHELRRTWRLAALGIGSALLLLFFPACKQGLSERCQVNDDCADGLFCQLSSGTPTAGGICLCNSGSTADECIAQAGALPVDMAHPPQSMDMSAKDM